MSRDNEKKPAERFVDPLSNYDSKDYDDPLEKILATENVDHVSSRPFASVSPEASLEEAIRTLAGEDIGCLTVREEGELVGIFTAWDVLHTIVGVYDDLSSVPVSEVMTRDPFVVHESDSVSTCLTVMALHGCRHVPVINDDGEVVGVVNPRRLSMFLEKALSTSAEA